MRCHRGSPRRDDLGIGNIDEQWRNVGRFSVRRHCVEQELPNGVRSEVSEFIQSSVTGEPGGVAHEFPQPPMIGVLILDEAGCEDKARLEAPDRTSQFDGVCGFDFEMGIAVEINELDGCTQQGRGFFRLGHPLIRRAMRSGLTAGADDEVNVPAIARFLRDDSAAGEFDVVRMRAEDQQRRHFRWGGRYRLHRSGRWDRD